MKYNQKLIAWAEKVIDKVTPIAMKEDKSYYPMQTQAKMYPKLLIIGLNPRDTYNTTYESQVENPNWGFKEGKMTVDGLLYGNPFIKDFSTWYLSKGLKSLPVLMDFINNDEYCFMNYVYLATNNFNDALSMKETIQVCSELTKEFIQITKPQHVLILGTANGFDLFPSIYDKKLILKGHINRLLLKGKMDIADFQTITVYAIPHTSRWIYSKEEIEALNTNLKETFTGIKITPFYFKRKERKSKESFEFDLNKLNDLLPKHLQFNRSGKCLNLVMHGSVDTLLFRIVLQSDKYIALGVTDEVHKQHGKYSYQLLKNAEQYLELIPYARVAKTARWLVEIDLRSMNIEAIKDLTLHLWKNIA